MNSQQHVLIVCARAYCTFQLEHSSSHVWSLNWDFIPQGLRHQEPQIFMLLLMCLSLAWMLWYLLWARKKPGICPHKDHHAGGITVTGRHSWIIIWTINCTYLYYTYDKMFTLFYWVILLCVRILVFYNFYLLLHCREGTCKEVFNWTAYTNCILYIQLIKLKTLNFKLYLWYLLLI